MTDQYGQGPYPQPSAQPNPQPPYADPAGPPAYLLGDPGQPGPKRNRWKPLVVAGAGLLALFVLVLGGLAVYDVVREDSGIAGCKSLADRSTAANQRKLTGAEYHELRDLFAGSDYQGIREHGTELLDLVWQVSQLPDGEEFGALPLLPTLSAHALGLQQACADQGVVIDLKVGE
jgi:hypothetical protein